jgi:hypothetical protein
MRIVAALLSLALTSSASATNCDTDLKPADTYKDLSSKLKCLNDRINALEGYKSELGSKAVNTENPMPIKTGASFKGNAGPFSIEVMRCLHKGGNTECQVKILTGEDGDLLYYLSETLIFDSSGEMRLLMDIHGKNVDKPSSRRRQDNMKQRIVSGVPFLTDLIFEGYSVEAISIAKLEVTVRPSRQQASNLVFPKHTNHYFKPVICTNAPRPNSGLRGRPPSAARRRRRRAPRRAPSRGSRP